MVDTRFQRWASEVIFPLIGFLFWNWSFEFVAWFYFGDRFFQWVFNFIKKRKIQGGFWKGQSLVSLELVLILLLIGQTKMPWMDSLHTFLTYEDMGIAQGYFLIPLLFLGEWMKYSMERKSKVFQMENPKVTLLKIGLWGSSIILFLFVFSSVFQIQIFLGMLAMVNLWIDVKKVPVSLK